MIPDRSVKSLQAWAATVGCLLAMLLSSGTATSQDSAVTSAPLLFVGQGQPNQTTIYNMQNQPIGIVPAGDGATAFDREGDFYDVPANANALLIFAPPYKHESARIGFAAVPFDVAVDTRTGVYAVSLYNNTVSDVQFFRHGSQAPCATVVSHGGALGGGAAFDREGRLFIADYENNGYITVASISGECNATSVQVDQFPLLPNIYPEPPFTFTSENNLVFQDGRTQDILTFAHPQNGRFGQPLATTKLKAIGPKGMGVKCFTGDGKYLWATALPFGPQLTKYHYPQGGAPIATIHLMHQYTCAAYPPIVP